jgi:hypothetical protein
VFAPKIAAFLAFLGFIGLPASAIVGVSPEADYILDAVEVCLGLAAAILLGYVAAGILLDAYALKTN